MLAVLACSASFAQFQRAIQCREASPAKGVNTIPTWGQISTPFTATDIWGNTVSVADILASGQGIVIDYSCCWCGPCWSMHQSGILEAIDALPNVQVIWVEIEESNTIDQIFGINGGTSATTTGGNWTLTTSGDTVPYPIIDDASCLNMCASLYEGYVPSIYFISPNGYFCDVYGTEWGFSGVSDAAAAISNLMNTYPQSGQTPLVDIAGMSRVINGNAATFSAEVVSVDPVTSYSWTIQGGTPATGNGQSVTTTWTANGTYTVTLEVTNANGTTTATKQVEVYEMGDLLTYDNGGDAESFVGTNGGEMHWGVRFPAALLAGRNYVKSVDLVVGSSYPGNYTLKIYQGGSTAPQTEVYNKTYRLTGNDTYQTLTVGSAVAIDPTKDLWITFHTNGITYPAAYNSSNDNPDARWVSLDGYSWEDVAPYGFDGAVWMIGCTTGDEPNTGINTVSDASISVYPNPTSDLLTITAEGLKEVNILDVNGRVVMTANTNTVDMSNLSNGVYFVSVVTNNGVSTRSIVKE
mgnify:CR=1 FL=1